MSAETYDCVIIGGGPAGLSTALVLTRARRSVLVVDGNRPRNSATFMAHGFLTRDGIPPHELRELARQDIAQYPNADFQWGTVTGITGCDMDFTVEITGVRGDPDRVVKAKKVMLATGLSETLPEVPNIRGFYGSSLFSCVHCDGWERSGESLVVIAEKPGATLLAQTVSQWTDRLTLLTNGSGVVSDSDRRLLERAGIAVEESPVTELVGHRGALERALLADGTAIQTVGGFVQPVWALPAIVTGLVATATAKGGVKTDEYGRSSTPGVYAAGDIRGIVPSQLIIAAGDGSRAAVGINRDLIAARFAQLS